MYTIHFWPILIATIVSYVIGAFWYSPVLFGGEWMRLLGISEKEMGQTTFANTWKLYLAQFIITLISFIILAFIMSATGVQSVGDGALIGFLVWLGFIAVDGAGKVLWEKKPLKLVLIGSCATLVTLVIGGMIIGAWR